MNNIDVHNIYGGVHTALSEPQGHLSNTYKAFVRSVLPNETGEHIDFYVLSELYYPNYTLSHAIN